MDKAWASLQPELDDGEPPPSWAGRHGGHVDEVAITAVGLNAAANDLHLEAIATDPLGVRLRPWTGPRR